MSKELLRVYRESKHPFFKWLRTCVYNLRIYRSNRQTEKLNIIRRSQWYDMFAIGVDEILIEEQGYRMLLFKDSELSNLIYTGFEENEIKFFRHFLRADDAVVDIGANIGLFTLEAASLVGPTGRVLSFEPDPHVFTRLKRNVDINKFEQVQCCQQAVSSTITFLKFHIANKSFDAWNSLAPIPSKKISHVINVSTTTIDATLNETTWSTLGLTLIKIDVEGWELEVIKGGKDYFMRNEPVVMVEFTEVNLKAAGTNSNELYLFMIEIGYKWYSYNGESLIPAIQKKDYPYENLLAIKNIEKVIERIQKQ